ncbi:hypothetical protein HMP0721_0182 [Pseudoramibacter alactolyticus ATCC 23263]|uniref:Uncharacterized protein n=1 Tax=Pseudoramibacter alactolyticus ATCC 23263 TaxID=887929 RepID=E6MDU9_9FIRM|nr:hypothetical protein HMP0721_0182 [Pseudoramibacter alactolyticus ATCC 23263]
MILWMPLYNRLRPVFVCPGKGLASRPNCTMINRKEQAVMTVL